MSYYDQAKWCPFPNYLWVFFRVRQRKKWKTLDDRWGRVVYAVAVEKPWTKHENFPACSWTSGQEHKVRNTFFLAKNQFTSRLVWWGRFFKKKVPLQVRDGENLVCCSDYFHLCNVKSRWCVSFPEQGLMPKWRPLISVIFQRKDRWWQEKFGRFSLCVSARALFLLRPKWHQANTPRPIVHLFLPSFINPKSFYHAYKMMSKGLSQINFYYHHFFFAQKIPT